MRISRLIEIACGDQPIDSEIADLGLSPTDPGACAGVVSAAWTALGRRLDDIESRRLDDIESRLDDIESRLNDLDHDCRHFLGLT